MFIRHHVGQGRGRSCIAGPKMLVVKDRIYYTPSPEALAVISQWPRGVDLTWEINDETLQPQAVHLAPALNHGLKLAAQYQGRSVADAGGWSCHIPRQIHHSRRRSRSPPQRSSSKCRSGSRLRIGG